MKRTILLGAMLVMLLTCGAFTCFAADDESVAANMAEIEYNIRDLYEGPVIGDRSGRTRDYDPFERYCTRNLLKRFELEYYEEYEETGGRATWRLRGTMTDSDPRDRVQSVEAGPDNTVIVTFTDCGFICKQRLGMKKEDGIWKVDDYKLIYESEKSTFPEWQF